MAQIFRKNQAIANQPDVMLSLDDYQALEETAYLLRNPNNVRRLLDSISS